MDQMLIKGTNQNVLSASRRIKRQRMNSQSQMMMASNSNK